MMTAAVSVPEMVYVNSLVFVFEGRAGWTVFYQVPQPRSSAAILQRVNYDQPDLIVGKISSVTNAH